MIRVLFWLSGVLLGRIFVCPFIGHKYIDFYKSEGRELMNICERCLAGDK